MKQCPNCRHMNPPEAAFCMNCGTRLEARCANCGAALPVGARFCMNCGQPVAAAEQAGPATMTTPSSEITRPAPIEGERKIITVLFADVVNSTALAESLDPEVWTEIMNRAFALLSPAIYRYEGTIGRLMGDALLAFFGAPAVHEDDPVRAVHAALELLEAAARYAAELRRQYGINFAMRVGLNTGEAVVGQVGSSLMSEYTAMGDAVNLAARMQSAAEPDTALVAEDTYRLAAPFFDFEDRGKISVKGKSEPIHIYRALRPRVGGVQVRGIAGLRSALVGRDAEMGRLQAAVERLRQGRGQIVSVMGEAGLGKSRLVAELRDSHMAPNSRQNGLLWLEGRSFSYKGTVPYAPFIDLLTGLFDLDSAQSEADRYSLVRRAVAERLPGRVGEMAPFIGQLLGLAVPEEESERFRFLEPPQLRQATFGAVAGLLEAVASEQPLVLVLDDLHWADPTSIGLLEQLLPLTDRAALMIVAIFRTRRHEPAWRFHEISARDYVHRYSVVSLEPLDESASRQLVANLLEIENLPEKARGLILHRAEGNPFYVEEVIRSLLDAGLVVRQNGHWVATREIDNIAVPETLVGVIAARLDRLDPAAKLVAQEASVVGREFGLELLEHLHRPAAELAPALGELLRRELIREKGQGTERVFEFKHVLTQETAYSSMLLSRRRSLHLAVAEQLERSRPDAAAEIARHFSRAQVEERALPYLVEAGDRAARAYSTSEAMIFYEEALRIIQQVENLALAQRVYEGMGAARRLSNDLAGAHENYQSMLGYAEVRNDAPMQVSALNKLSEMAAWMGHFEEVESYLQRAEKLATEAEDLAGLSEMYTIRCGVCNMVGDFQGAARYLSDAIQLGRRQNVKNKEQLAFGLTHMANTLLNMTEFDRSWEVAHEALEVSSKIGDLLHQAEVLATILPSGYLRQGKLEEARKTAQEAQALAHRIGATVLECLATYRLGTIAHYRGEYELALETCNHSWALGRATGVPPCEVLPLATLGLVYQDISAQLKDRAIEHHEQALKLLDLPIGAMAGGTAWADVGFCLLANGRIDEAERALRKGLERPSPDQLTNRPRYLAGLAYVKLSQGGKAAALDLTLEARDYSEARAMKHLTPELALAEGRVRSAMGNLGEALAQFERAEQFAREMGMRPAIWQALVEEARVHSALGHGEEARQKQADAASVVAEMGALFSDVALLAAFEGSARAAVEALIAGPFTV